MLMFLTERVIMSGQQAMYNTCGYVGRALSGLFLGS
jgi:hypothetical protein